jgi:mannose-6-phosphate isomerase
MTNDALYPLCLQAVQKEKVWGGRNLERLLGKSLPANALIGETWEAWEGCLIANGAREGQSLQSLIDQDADAILGSAASQPKRFPLLFKFIDARDDLSVQVHPNDEQARAMEGQPFGKTEAWYILDAEPGARLVFGFKRDVQPAEVVAALQTKHLVDLLAFVPVQRGDVVFVPAGTVHAIGKGIVLAEIQENSDLTYRFYDWDRNEQGRALHVDQSLRVFSGKHIEQPKVPSVVLHREGFDEQFLVACRYFALTLAELDRRVDGLSTGAKFQILSIIDGAAEVLFGAHFASRVPAEQGQTIVLPARLGAYAIAPRASCKILRAFVPDLQADVVAPLLQAGYDTATIMRLGGAIAEHNDLARLLRF